jgi:hypothetical protein
VARERARLRAQRRRGAAERCGCALAARCAIRPRCAPPGTRMRRDGSISVASRGARRVRGAGSPAHASNGCCSGVIARLAKAALKISRAA